MSIPVVGFLFKQKTCLTKQAIDCHASDKKVQGDVPSVRMNLAREKPAKAKPSKV